jgi:hypothetical protein
MKFYAYCLTEDIDALAETLQGVAGTEVRLFKTESFSLLVSEFSGAVVPVNRDNALAHAAVVRSVLDRTTPLPFRFGTLASEEQLRSYVAARRDALLAKFGEVRGCVEMNVKIISGQELTQEVDRDEEKPGTSFLLQKRQEISGTEKAKEVAGWLDGAVAEYVRRKEIRTNVTNQLILAAAHLVERDVVSHYRDRLKAARNERPELKFLISGPWPPYSFANTDL